MTNSASNTDTAATKSAADRRSEIVEKLVLSLSQGKLPWEMPWSGGYSGPVNASTLRGYKGFNWLSLLAAMQARGFTDPRWATFQQAKAKGWKVKKGAKSEPIFYAASSIKLDAPFKGKTWWEKSDLQSEGGAHLPGVTMFTLKFSSIFNAEEIEGIPERPVFEKKEGALSSAFLEALATKLVPMKRGGNEAYLSGKNSEIWMPESQCFVSEEAEAATILHEYAHATGIERCLNRESLLRYQEEDFRAVEEVVAESASAMTMAALGLPYLANHASYVQSWAKGLLGETPKDRETKFLKALKDGANASDMLIEIHEAL